MKVKKAIRRLAEARELLDDVLARYSEAGENERAAIEVASRQVLEAKAALLETADRKVKRPPPQPARGKSKIQRKSSSRVRSKPAAA